jgi:hypothetical protein
LSGAELHGQLLRLVYRFLFLFLFLFTAEDRDLLFPRTISQDDARRRIDREGYSVGRLLELHPQLERSGGSWQLSYSGGAGSDRKTTGSYYTPDRLVQLLITSALLPVITDRLEKVSRLSKASTREEKQAALLAIRVLDPACGGGHFLLAAARRLALELARIRAEDEEPSEELRPRCPHPVRRLTAGRVRPEGAGAGHPR